MRAVYPQSVSSSLYYHRSVGYQRVASMSPRLEDRQGIREKKVLWPRASPFADRPWGFGSVTVTMDAKLPMDEQPHRRTTRVLFRIPIKVKASGANGQPFDEETFTVMIDGHRAQIVLKNSPRRGNRLTITNLRSGKSCPSRVVRRVSNSPSEEAEWGIECLRPETNFGGIYFPAKASPPLPAEIEIIEGLRECHQCSSQEMARLTLEEYKILQRLNPEIAEMVFKAIFP